MTTVWRRSAEVAVVESPDRTVVLRLDDVSGCAPRILEGSAVLVWRLIDGVRSVASIADELAERFAADAGVVGADVHGFLGDLEREGLIEPAESAGAIADSV